MLNLYTSLHVLAFTVSDRVKALKEERGASAVEYALLVGLIAAVVAAAVLVFGGKLTALFNSVDPKVPTVPASGS